MLSRTLTLCALVVVLSTTARAQFSGTVGLDLESASNIQRLDTTSPDLILLPAITLSYQVRPSAVTAIPATVAWLPGYYTTNNSLSYTALLFAVTPSIYLSDQDAIASEAEQRMQSASMILDSVLVADENARADQPQASQSSNLPNQQWVDLTITELYAASVALDSMDIVKSSKAEIRHSKIFAIQFLRLHSRSVICLTRSGTQKK